MARKPDIGRIDIDRYQEERGFYLILRQDFLIFADWFKHDTVWCKYFYDAIRGLKIGTMEDPEYISCPIHTKGIRVRRMWFPGIAKEYCLLGAIYATIRLWWKYLKKQESANKMRHYVSYLDNIATNGLDKFDWIGNLRQGYRLKS